MSPVRLDRDGSRGIITLDNPPLNLFDAELTNAPQTSQAPAPPSTSTPP